jgi:hypothetical protein
MVSSNVFFNEYSLHLVYVLGLNIYFECHFISTILFHHCCLVSLACERFTVHSKYFIFGYGCSYCSITDLSQTNN